MTKTITVSSIDAAWDVAAEFFPHGCHLDTISSDRAGYPIYRSPVNRYDYICDVGRLEINLVHGNQTINVCFC